MIENDTQYQVTKREIAKFEEALKGLPNPSLPPAIRKAQVAAVESVLEELRAEVREYENRATP